MINKLDYLDPNYPFKYDSNFNTYQILCNTKILCKNTKKYNNFTNSFTKMTTKSSYMVPEVQKYPILQNSDMISITRQSFNFSRPSSSREPMFSGRESIRENSADPIFVK